MMSDFAVPPTSTSRVAGSALIVMPLLIAEVIPMVVRDARHRITINRHVFTFAFKITLNSFFMVASYAIEFDIKINL